MGEGPGGRLGGTGVCVPHPPQGGLAPPEAWCPTGDDSTDGSAAAPDDDGKDDAKAEDLGEPRGPPPAVPAGRRVVRDRPTAESSAGPWRGGLERLQP